MNSLPDARKWPPGRSGLPRQKRLRPACAKNAPNWIAAKPYSVSRKLQSRKKRQRSQFKAKNSGATSKPCVRKNCDWMCTSKSWNRNGKRAALGSPRWKTTCVWVGSLCRSFGKSAAMPKSNVPRMKVTGNICAKPEDLIASEAVFMSGEELAAAEANYREMKQRIDSMGAVNMMALEEFNECEQRFTFLTRERDDLLQSIADTQQAIAELDLISKEKFEQAFNAINTNFSTAFHAIFGGGMAEMRLTEPDSSGDAGIDVVASPPGKRLQNVLLLSGGEKAMTALALLIAIFRYQPSPFCILDQVDAPLDEANVGR